MKEKVLGGIKGSLKRLAVIAIWAIQISVEVLIAYIVVFTTALMGMPFITATIGQGVGLAYDQELLDVATSWGFPCLIIAMMLVVGMTVVLYQIWCLLDKLFGKVRAKLSASE